MSEFFISLEGKLEEVKTSENIRASLKKVVAPQLNNQESLKLILSLNEKSSLEKIKKQLKAISANLELDINVSPKVSDKNVKLVKKDIDEQMAKISDLQNKTTNKEIASAKEFNSLLEERSRILKKVQVYNREGNLTSTNIQYSNGLGATTNIVADSEDKVITQRFIDNIQLRQNAVDKLTESIKISNLEFQTFKSKVENDLSKDTIKDSTFLKSINEIDFDKLNNVDLSQLNEVQLKAVQDNLSKMTSEIKIMKAEYKSLVAQANSEIKLNKKSQISNKLQDDFSKQIDIINKEIVKIPSKIDNIEVKFKRLGTSIPKNVASNIKQLKNDFTELEKIDDPTKRITEYNKLNKKIAEVEGQYKKYASSIKQTSTEQRLLTDKITFSNRITTWLNENTKASKELRQQMLILRDSIEEADNVKFGQLKKEFQSLKTHANATGQVGRSIIDELKNNVQKFTSWFMIGNIVATLTSNVRTAVSELKEIDTVLTEISKTSDRTNNSLKKLGAGSFDAANQYGSKASDYLKGVQEMSRAGYDEQSTEELAKLSTLAQSAGDMSAELSNQYLIATDKAYDFKGSAEELNAVLDSQNYITNRNALSMEDLANATKITASQAKQAGVGIDEMTAAVGTMMAVTQQGGEVAARSYKGILMNLQQVTGELDDGEVIDKEALTKYEKAANDLGVALKEIKDGVLILRNPMESLNDLAIAFNAEADDSIKKANLINAIGGKYRGNQLTALLSNWDTYQKMLKEFNSEDAIGSAEVEAQKTADSWEGRVKKLSNSWTELVSSFINSDDVKKILGIANDGLQTLDGIIDKLGVMPTLISAITVAASVKNKGRGQMSPLFKYALPYMTVTLNEVI